MAAARLVAPFAETDGGRHGSSSPRSGQDGHDRGQKVIASSPISARRDRRPALPDARRGGARRASTTAIHILGVSTLAAGHPTLVPEVKRARRRRPARHHGGGRRRHPPQDYEALRDAGAAAIFPPGTPIAGAAATLVTALNQRLGYAPPDRANFPTDGRLPEAGL